MRTIRWQIARGLLWLGKLILKRDEVRFVHILSWRDSLRILRA